MNLRLKYADINNHWVAGWRNACKKFVYSTHGSLLETVRSLAGSDDCRQKQIIKRVTHFVLSLRPQSAIKGGRAAPFAAWDKFTSSHPILLLLEKAKSLSCGGGKHFGVIEYEFLPAERR